MDNVDVPYQNGYDCGIGVNSASGKSRQKGVTGDVSPVETGSGGSGNFYLFKIEKTGELEEHLGISAEASAGVGLFSASARFNYAKNSKVQSKSIFLLLVGAKTMGFQQIDKPVLDAEAAALVENGKSDLFFQRYGDCFVRGIQSGGQFFGLIKIDVTSKEDREKIDTSLGGSYGLFSAKVQTNMESALKETKARTSASIYYEGGDVQTAVQSPEDMLKAFGEWSKSVMSAPKPYSVQLVPWIIANGPLPPNAADLQTQKDVLMSCARLRSHTMDDMNLLEYILRPQNQSEFQFEPGELETLTKAFAGIQDDYNVIQRAASHALENAANALEPVPFAHQILNRPEYAPTSFTIPKSADTTKIKAPDFSSVKTWSEMQELAKTSDVVVRYETVNRNEKTYSFISQDHPAGTPVVPKQPILVTGNGYPSGMILITDRAMMTMKINPLNRAAIKTMKLKQ